ncbi:hypothetical protein AAWM_01905 [Aspergillus awamori]|uniref:Uncharacterized protein n=1 Tax=Aspergillus awamori TaxID=105351 RepID=A0A401KI07_ASPAW|nr:hypothetical protein AAWM_01905 [Aspergillus awamori]GKZ61034.1 hypothetical protein AnigIFM49718_007739 [Aspergillus niger]
MPHPEQPHLSTSVLAQCRAHGLKILWNNDRNDGSDWYTIILENDKKRDVFECTGRLSEDLNANLEDFFKRDDVKSGESIMSKIKDLFCGRQ